MIGLSRASRPRDPQAGVTFRPPMLVHAGSLIELGRHRLARREESDGRDGKVTRWSVIAAGLMAAFLLGNAWSTPRPDPGADARLATVSAPAAGPRTR